MAVVKTRDGAGRWRGRGATAGPLAEPSRAAPRLLGGHATALAKAQGGREAQGPIRDVVATEWLFATHRASRQVRPPSILTPTPCCPPPGGKALNPEPRTGAYVLASGSDAKGQRADVRPGRSCPPRSGLGRCRGRGRARPRDVLPESEPHAPSFGSGCFDARPNGFRKIKII